MKEIFLEYIDKYESGFNFDFLSLNLFGHSFISWIYGILIVLVLNMIFDYFLFKILHPIFDLDKDGKSDIHFYKYVDSKVNKKVDKNILLSFNNNDKENISILKKYFLILSKKYIKLSLNTSKLGLVVLLLGVYGVSMLFEVDDRNEVFEDFYNEYSEEVSETVTYDIVEIKNDVEDEFIVTYLDDENKLQDIKLKRNDFTLDMEVNLDNPEVNKEVLGYIEFKNPIDIDYIKSNLKSDDIDLNDYESFFEALENKYSDLVFEKVTIFDLDYLN